MIFHRIATERGCQSYLLGCEQSAAAALIDPEDSLLDRYRGLAAQEGLRIAYVIDTHTHADHFSGTAELGRELGVPVVMHRASQAPYVDLHVDDGERIKVGRLALNVLYTPGHTVDSICLQVDDRVFTGDSLLIGGCGRTDLPTGDPGQLYDSLFGRLLRLDPATLIFPAHKYGAWRQSTIGEELRDNPRLQCKTRAAFIEQMQTLALRDPDHLTEALRTNLSGGQTVEQLIAEAARNVSFMALEEVLRRLQAGDPELLLLDVREGEAYAAGHLPGAVSIPRGQLELRVNGELQDPTRRIVVYCEYGKVSTLATATLRRMGFTRAVALDQGLQAWRESGYPLETSS